MKKISFFTYMVNIGHISKENLMCARTYGWGDDSFIKLEYTNNVIKRIKPIRLAKRYLKNIHDIVVTDINFNNAHYDRIGCSCINIYSLEEEFKITC